MFAPHAGLPFVGIPTFAGVPHVSLEDAWRADAAVIGVPYDFAVGFRPGARFAPRAIRDSSMRYPISAGPMWLGDVNRYLYESAIVVDVGDVDIVQLEYEESFRRITESIRALRAHDAIPVVLGGDHSITYPVIRGFDGAEPLHIIQFDAHLDYLDSRSGTRYSNSSPFRRIQESGRVKSITTVGLRGIRTSPDAYRDATAAGNTLIWASDVEDHGIEWVTRQFPKGAFCYVSIDIDGLDAAIAPGTGSPEPGGLTFRALQRMLRWIADNTTVVGFDLVEVSPMVDPTGMTSLVAAHIVVEFLGMVLSARRQQDAQ